MFIRGNCRNRKYDVIVSYHADTCKCVRKTKRKYKKCDKFEVVKELPIKYSKCDLVTGRQRWVKSFLKINEEGNKSVNRIVGTRKCACPGKLRRNWKYCEKSSGDTIVVNEKRKFNSNTHRCEKTVRRERQVLLCPDRKVRRSQCGADKENYVTVVVTGYYRRRQQCKCEEFTRKGHILCKAPKSKLISRYCSHTLGCRVHVIQHFYINKNTNKLGTFIQKKRKFVTCPKNIKTKKSSTINGKYYVTKSKYIRVGCSCKKIVKKTRYLTECQASTSMVKCHGSHKLLTTITYHLADQNRRCESTVTKKVIPIRCQKGLITTRSQCQNCNRNVSAHSFRVLDCKCVRVKRFTKNELCCCAGPVSKRQCKRGLVFLHTSSEKLMAGTCHKTLDKQLLKTVKCGAPSRTCTPCDKDRYKTVTYISNEIVGCKCVPRTTKIRIHCGCSKRLVTLRGKCVDYRRAVTLNKYQYENKRCRLSPVFELYEDCEGRPPVIKTTTINHKCKRHRVTSFDKITYVENRGINLKKVIPTFKDRVSCIKCKKPKNVRHPCVNNRQCSHKIIHLAQNQHCFKKVLSLGCKACKCHQLNREVKRCNGKNHIILNYAFTAVGSKCVKVVNKSIKKVYCPKSVSRSDAAPCQLDGNDRVKLVKHVSYHVSGCQCQRKVNTVRVNCGCKNGFSKESCFHGSVLRLRIYDYTYRCKRCILRKREIYKPMVCPRNFRIRKGKCNSNCRQVITLTYNLQKNCRCNPRVVKKTKICCVKTEPIVNKYCKNGFLITEITTIRRRPTCKCLFPADNRWNYHRKYVLYRHVERMSKEVKCGGVSRIRRQCDKSTGIATVTIQYKKRSGCNCVWKKKVKTRRCFCSPLKVTYGSCERCERTVTIKKSVLIEGKCVKRVKTVQQKCCCKKPTSSVKCNSNTGRIVRTIVNHSLTRHFTCQKHITKYSVSSLCPIRPRVRPVQGCSTQTGFRIIEKSYSEYDKSTCVCKRVRKQIKIRCSCVDKAKFARNCHDNNKIVQTFTRSQLLDGKCVKRTQKIQHTIICSFSRVFRSGCNADGYRRVTYHTQIPVECKCKLKTIVKKEICNCSRIGQYKLNQPLERNCLGDKRQTTFRYYVAVKGKCQLKKRTSIQSVKCNTNTYTETGKCENCVQEKRTYGMRVSDCKCVRHLIKSTSHKCCCSKKKIVTKRCVNNMWKHTSSFLSLQSGRCLPLKVTRLGKVPCHHKSSYLKHCPKDNCKGALYKISFRIDDCQCRRVRTFVKNIDCCCKGPSKNTKCERNTKIVKTTTSFELVNNKCKQTRETRVKFCNCEHKPCRVKFSDCINNHRYVSKICYRAQNCKCQPFVASKERERCGCDKSITKRESNCNRSTCYQATNLYRLTWDNIRKKCIQILFSRSMQRCCCGAGSKSKHCTSNQILRTIKVTKKLTKTGCVSIRNVVDRPMEGCSLVPRQMFRLTETGPCSRQTMRQTVVKVFVKARNCKCHQYRIKSSRLCACSSQKVHQESCVKNSVRRSTVKFYRFINGACTLQTSEKFQTVFCANLNKVKVIRGNCLGDMRLISRYVVRVNNCHCRLVLLSSKKVPCFCKKGYTTTTCNRQTGEIVTRTLSYRLTEDGCVASTSQNVQKVSCKVGVFKKREQCLQKYGNFFITTTKVFLNGCRCERLVHRKQCRCNCPRESVRRHCVDNEIVTIKTRYERFNCKCKKTVQRIVARPKCESFESVQKMECVHGDIKGERIIKYTRPTFEGCKCVLKVKKVHRLCWCKPGKQVTTRCRQGGVKVTITKTRRIKDGQCAFYPAGISAVEMKCAKPHKSVSRTDNGYTITTVYSKLENCKCQKIVRKKHIITKLSCNFKEESDGQTECNRKTCLRTKYYKYQKVNAGKCVNRRFALKQQCCCPANSESVQCLAGKGFIRRTSIDYALKNGKCVKKIKHNLKCVKCQKIDLQYKTVPANKYGYVRVNVFNNVRKGCKCAKQLVRTFLQQVKCKPSTRKTVCQSAQMRKCIITVSHKLVTISKYNKYCKTSSVKKYIPFKCLPPKVSIKCDKKTGIRTLIKTTYRPTSKCDCTSSTVKFLSRCMCSKNVSTKRYCQNRTMVTVQSRWKLTAQNQCQLITSQSEERVVCRQANFKTFSKGCKNGQREVHFHSVRQTGCKCVSFKRVKSFPCKCAAATTVNTCINGNQIRTTITSYSLRNFTCLPSQRSLSTSMVCQQPSVVRSRCDRGTCRRAIRITKYILKNCKCVKVTRVLTPLCCCRKAAKKVICKKGTRIVSKTSYNLSRGECLSQVSVSTFRRFCGPKVEVLNYSSCDKTTKLQTITAVRNTASGCECNREKFTYKKLCGCRRMKRIFSECNTSTCYRSIRHRQFQLNNGRCEGFDSEIKYERCCCRFKSGSKVTTIGNQKVRIVTVVRFNPKTKICNKSVTQIPLPVECDVKRWTVKSPCNHANNMFKITTFRRFISGNKCLTKSSTKIGYCACKSPQVKKFCEINKFLVVRKIWHHLTKNYQCVRNVSEKRKSVKCDKSLITDELKIKPICNRKTCKINKVHRSIILSNCRCQVKENRYEEACCCRGRRPVQVPFSFLPSSSFSPSSSSSSFSPSFSSTVVASETCDTINGRIIRTRTSQRFDSVKKRCIFSKNIRSTPIACKTAVQTHFGSCAIRRGRNLYRRLTKFFFRRQACKCLKKEHSFLQLCGCEGSRTQKICKNGKKSVVKLTYTLKVDKKQRNCQINKQVLWSKKVNCQTQNIKFSGQCNKVTCNRVQTEHRYEQVGCRCVLHNIKKPVTCCCRAKPTSHECKVDKRITIRHSATLNCDKDSTNCQCSYKAHQTVHKVNCPRPFAHVQKCNRISSFTTTATTVFYTIDNCRCHRKVSRKSVNCAPKSCGDISSESICLKGLREGKCRINLLFRSKLCRKTCGACKKCSGNQKFRKYSKTSLHTQAPDSRIIRSVQVIKGKSFRESVKICSQLCKTKLDCESFEIHEIGVGKVKYRCLLNTVNSEGLRRLTQGKNGPVSNSRRVLFEKFCQKSCPKSKRVSLGDCRCQFIGDKKSCSRELVTILWREETMSGGCAKMTRKFKVSCQKACSDEASASRCALFVKQNKCHENFAKNNCLKSCGLCDCGGKFVHRGQCLNGERKDVVVIKYRRFGLCVKRTRIRVRKCAKTCSLGNRVIKRVYPMPCVGGTRKVITIIKMQKNGQCVRTVKKKTFKCEGCCPSVNVYPAKECEGNRRRIVTVWWVLLDNCCRRQTNIYYENCAGCRGEVVKKFGDCRFGKQVVYKYWFFKRFGQSICSKRVIQDLIDC